MRVILDATPLLGARTGIGSYTAHVLSALARTPEALSGSLELRVTTFSARARRVSNLPARVRQVGAPLPARLLRFAWQRAPFPPIELLAGRCDVVHGTNFVSPPTLRAAEVVTVHDLTYLELPETVTPDVLAYRILVANAVKRGAHVLTPTRVVAQKVGERYNTPADRVHVTPLGVGPAWLAAHGLDEKGRARLGLPEQYLVFVGSLDPRKNLPTLVKAHAQARRVDRNLPPLVLAGPSGRAVGLDSPDVVRTGWLEDEDLRSVVAGSAGLILPSLDEGFGLPVLEALACGRPVLASDLPVLREVAGEEAVYAEPTLEGLTDGLHRLMDRPDGAAERDRRRARAGQFTWAATAARTLDAYRAATK